MDLKLANLVEKYQESILKSRTQQDDENFLESDEDLLELLNEDDDVISKFREERIQQLSKEFKKVDDHSRNSESGEINYMSDEKALMDIVTKSGTVLVHFYQPQFTKCQIMNDRLSVLSEKHLTIQVLAIQAEQAPFLVTKLGIKTLPFVVVYQNGKEVTRIIGFEKLGNNPNSFTIESLEQYLYIHKVINRRTINFSSVRSKSSLNPNESDEDDLDL